MARKMNVLVTCGRFYPSLALVRALHDGGARVDVADAYKLAPALHSHAAAEGHVVPSPAKDTLNFVAAVADIVRRRDIDLVAPTFEDGFYLSRYADMIPAPLFAPPFATIAPLHDKAAFQGICQELGLRTPKTTSVASRAALREAIAAFDQYVARPAFSRGGYTYLTNHGPRAGEITVDDCSPTDDNPWLVQEYVDGHDACSFSVVRDGKVVVHTVYEPTVAATGGFAVQFSSIDDFGTLDVASKVAAKFACNGFLGFDYRRTGDGFVMIECNPRLTAGVFLTPADWVSDAVTGTPSGDVRVAPAGKKLQYDSYIVERHLTHLTSRQKIHELLTTPDATMTAHDVLPVFYAFISRRHFTRLAAREHLDLAEVLFGDTGWNGSPMPAPQAASGAT